MRTSSSQAARLALQAQAAVGLVGRIQPNEIECSILELMTGQYGRFLRTQCLLSRTYCFVRPIPDVAMVLKESIYRWIENGSVAPAALWTNRELRSITSMAGKQFSSFLTPDFAAQSFQNGAKAWLGTLSYAS